MAKKKFSNREDDGLFTGILRFLGIIKKEEKKEEKIVVPYMTRSDHVHSIASRQAVFAANPDYNKNLHIESDRRRREEQDEEDRRRRENDNLLINTFIHTPSFDSGPSYDSSSSYDSGSSDCGSSYDSGSSDSGCSSID